ncbi:SCO2522 family protein [Nocardia sp. NBC_00881]|uniref:SCO2522 family protein n=1 Tax=Nocardia sp. NBC_00881 TaxID=2975995 RepID=UPI00386D3E4B|nr:SCO2522 family protein [Nocardia sp. NBC_00881]
MDYVAGYSEATERTRIAQVPLSHLSIEVGHFYMNDLNNGEERIRAQFRKVAPLVTAFTAAAKAEFGPRARVSTCFLIDDYFRHDTDPSEILGQLLGAAAHCGVTIDYLAREAGCWETPSGSTGERRIQLAEMVAARIVAEPPEGSTGRRPPTAESGWLCNGRRASDDEPGQAMHRLPYEPPEEFGRREHSIFLDVQMWTKQTKKVNGRAEVHTKWSCPFLASIWQLLRLGMLRYDGEPVVDPQLWRPEDGWPQHWWEMPAVVKLNPQAKPFAAYRSLSLLPQRYLGIEHAVRVILDHIDLEEEVVDQVIARGTDEDVPIMVPRKVTERISHLLLDGS